MRKLLLAGAALAGLAALLPSAASAQSAVFPLTSRAGKLDGAAPGSVSVSIGGTFFTGLSYITGTGNSGDDHHTTPQMLNYLRLYPNFDYGNPAGIHFGISGEIRSDGSTQGQNRTTNALYWHSAFAYVSSDKVGKIEFGTPNDAVDALGVGTGDDYGTGGFYGEYGWPGAPNWISADAYDGDVPHQKITYLSPSLAGFSVGLSYQPNAVGLTNSSSLTNGGDVGASHQRYSGALAFNHAFGPAALKADVAYTGSDTGPGPVGTPGYKNVSIFDAGVSVTLAGFQVEGNVNTGQFAYNSPNGAEPVMGPELKGQKDTTEWLAGVGYTIGAFAVGAQYYHVGFDAGQLTNGIAGHGAHVSGEALSGSYAVGPGVNLNADFAHDEIAGSTTGRIHGDLAAIGAYFAW